MIRKIHGLHFNGCFDLVASKVRMVQGSVGLTAVNGVDRTEITGRGARQWLDTFFYGALPTRAGRVGLDYLFSTHGNVAGEAPIANVDEAATWYGSATASARHDTDWLRAYLPTDNSVHLGPLTKVWTALVLAGPSSRAVLSATSREDGSAAAFSRLSVRRALVGIAPAIVLAVSFSGEPAYGIHVPSNLLPAACARLRETGRTHGLGAVRRPRGRSHTHREGVSTLEGGPGDRVRSL